MPRGRLDWGRHTTRKLAVDGAAGEGKGVATQCEDLMTGLLSTGWSVVLMISLVFYRRLRLTL
jgi:hypothetical protein